MTAPTTKPGEDEFTELVDAEFPRVDLVGKGANGTPRWLIAKQAAGDGLLPPEYVRDLIAKAEPEAPVAEELVTMTGSPAAIAKMIHGAPVRGASGVAKEAAMDGPVTKADMGPELDEGVDGMDPTVPLAAPEEMGPGDPTDPGSPAWESIDAATAQKWTSIAVRLKNALCVMADREMTEAATVDPEGAESAWDLQDAMCAVDYVIDTLACFAVDEQTEADLGGEALEAIGKALAAFDPAPLEVVEGFAAVAKAGRVLSAANEGKIRAAAQSLQDVLSSLPKAPVTDEVTKEAAMAAENTTETAPAVDAEAPVAKAEETTPPAETAETPVAKAEDGGDGEVAQMMPVYDAAGNLCGVVKPSEVIPLQGAGKPKAEDAGDGEAAMADGGSAGTPAPPAEAGTPADGVAKEAGDEGPETVTLTTNVLKAFAADAVNAALEAQSASHQEAIAKMAGQAEEVRVLKAKLDSAEERLERVEKSDAPSKVFASGAVPPAGTVPPGTQLRGQDQAPGGGQPVDIAKARELKGVLSSGTPAEQNAAYNELMANAIDRLGAIRRQ